MNRRGLMNGLLLFFFTSVVNFAQPPSDAGKGFLETLIRTKMARFDFILSNPSRYRVQIIYTKIDRDAGNHPKLTTYYYRNFPAELISPASMVKLPLALLTLERLSLMQGQGITRDTRYATDSTFRCQVSTLKDPFAADSIPTLSGNITEALVFSDNDAYNRLYEFLGQKEINTRMWQLGYTGSRIIQRFSPCDSIANRHTNGFIFYDDKGNIVYRQPARFNSEIYPQPIAKMVIGKGYLDEHNRMVRHGMDFSKRIICRCTRWMTS